MRDIELFLYAAAAFAWVVYQVIRRALKPPRPLGRVEEEEQQGQDAAQGAQPPQAAQDAARERERERLLDTAWGRGAPPAEAPRAEVPSRFDAPLPIETPPRVQPPRGEPFPWARDAAQAELAAARELARRQEEARRLQQQVHRPRRHPHRPGLHTRQGLRQAVVAAAVLGPCRALDPYRPPD